MHRTKWAIVMTTLTQYLMETPLRTGILIRNRHVSDYVRTNGRTTCGHVVALDVGM